MNRICKALAAVAAGLFFTVQGANAVELGMPFGFGSNTTFGSHGGGHWGADVGLRIHFSDMVALQPNLSVGIGDDQTNLGINVDLLFYLFESNDIRMYLGGTLGLNVTDGDEDLRLGGIFGLQHPLNSAVDLFAQTGLGIRTDPGRVYTVNTQLGVIFYIMK